ncbi:hypothetical protein A6278_25710 [Bacillus wiedmannii]|uniref:DUF1904 family protein n=1 Tax=Bacillus wiedmannii TaxID=1890302 RepID=UPI0007DB2307|nr:DUF1904 family protein [Bacillus wiedmannii]OAK08768.1 hypothetical protein A6278_25710 [Bacillus wiedmannii]
MPHVVFRGITTEQLKRISKPLVEELAEICECGTDNFTLELPKVEVVFTVFTESAYYINGKHCAS